MTVHGHKHEHKKHVHVAPAYVTAFINAHAIEAQVVGMKYGIPASAILAQSALESDYGRKAPGNAYFGVKGKSPSGKSVQIATHEVINGQRKPETDAFRAFDSWADAADNYGELITTDTRYAKLLAVRHDALKYAEAMSHTPYATGIGYSSLMKSIIQTNNLTQYDH